MLSSDSLSLNHIPRRPCFHGKRARSWTKSFNWYFGVDFKEMGCKRTNHATSQRELKLLSIFLFGLMFLFTTGIELNDCLLWICVTVSVCVTDASEVRWMKTIIPWWYFWRKIENSFVKWFHIGGGIWRDQLNWLPPVVLSPVTSEPVTTKQWLNLSILIMTGLG